MRAVTIALVGAVIAVGLAAGWIADAVNAAVAATIFGF